MTSRQDFFVCGNTETLASGTYFQHTDPGGEFDPAVSAACRLIDDAGGNSKVSSAFHDWHGGRFDQFYHRIGFVAVAKDAATEMIAIAAQANDVMSSEIKKAESESEKADREFFAECLANDDSVNEWLIQEILMPAASFANHTRPSIARALRANDPSLLIWKE